jgi:glucosamine--fructose-6-phosphate aminotransferase (isomerizing)
MKEMSLTSAEAFYTLEFRHGPLSMVDEHTLVIGLLSEKGARYELAILQEVHNLGGRTLIMGEDIPSFGGSTGMILAFASGLPAPAYDVLYMPPVQLLAFLCAVSAGVDPDRPRHLRGCIIAPELEKEGKSAP